MPPDYEKTKFLKPNGEKLELRVEDVVEEEGQYFHDNLDKKTEKRNEVGLDDEGFWTGKRAKRLFVYRGVALAIDKTLIEIISGKSRAVSLVMLLKVSS